MAEPEPDHAGELPGLGQALKIMFGLEYGGGGLALCEGLISGAACETWISVSRMRIRAASVAAPAAVATWEPSASTASA